MSTLREIAIATDDEFIIKVKHDITQRTMNITVPGSWTEAQINELLPAHWYVA